MKFDWQRIGVIILFIASIFLFGFFIYWFFWQPLLGPATTPTATTTGQLTGAGAAGQRTYATGTSGLPSGASTADFM